MESLNHDWANDNIIDMLALPADKELKFEDLLDVPNIGEAEEIFKAYYPDYIRRDRAFNVYNYTNKIISFIAPRVLKASVLKMLLDFEWLAHMRRKVSLGGHSPKLYRDHILHPAYVCAIGWWMLSGKGPAPLRLKKIAELLEAQYGTVHSGHDWEDIAQRAWVLAALNHDLLYPVEFLETLQRDENVRKHTPWKKQLGRTAVRSILKGASMDIFKKQISMNALEGLIRVDKRSHAPLSALYLIGPESGYANLKPRRKIIHELAASAVLHHHSQDPKNIDYHRRPLGYLLALADECHEFGREMTVWTGRSDACDVKFIPPIISADIIMDGDDFTITFHLNGPNNIRALEQEGFDCTKYVSEKTEGFKRLNPFDPSSGAYKHGFSFQPKVL